MKYRLPAYLLLIVGTFALLQGCVVNKGSWKHLFVVFSNPPVTDKQLEAIKTLAHRASHDEMILAGCGLAVIVLATISISQMKSIQRAWKDVEGRPKGL